MLGSRSRAAREIAAGRVDVNGRTVTKASHEVAETDALTVTEPDPWVARSAHKLLDALEAFDLAPADLTGLAALDAGASTGGFTQVLLHWGLAEVWAVDVGHHQLAPTLREHQPIHMREALNPRPLAAHEPFALAPAGLTGLSALDAGASTGGFTQVLLHWGLAEVWAVDVGHDQLAPTLREHPRVHMREGLNLRDLAASDVPANDL